MQHKDIQISFLLAPQRVAALHVEQVLERNAKALEKQGVLVPPSKEARVATLQALSMLEMKKPLELIREEFFKSLVGDREDIHTLVAITPKMIGNFMRPFRGEMIYPFFKNRVLALGTIFADHTPQFFSVLRNPIGLALSSYFGSLKSGNRGSIEEYLANTNLKQLRWSAVLEDLSKELVVGKVALWRFEDYPAVLPNLVAEIGNIDPLKRLVHKSIAKTNPGLSAEGSYNLWEYSSENAAATPQDLEETITKLKTEHPSLAPTEDSFLLPNKIAQDITYAYDDDCYYIERLKGFRIVHPN